MQQSSYRSALQATPRRHKFGVSGINSRVQDTAWLLSHVAQPAGRSALPPRRGGVPNGVRGVNSRVQDTAWLLSHVAQPAGPAALPPSLPPLARAGIQGVTGAALGKGLGVLGADWLTQGLILAMGTEFVSRMINQDPGLEKLEKEAEVQEFSRQAEDWSGRELVGQDRFVYVIPSHLDRRISFRSGLGDAGGERGRGLGFNLPASVITATEIAKGTAAASSSTWLAAAGGPIGLAVAGVTTALTLLMGRKRPARKVATTNIVNEVEPLLKQNLQGYLNGPRTVSSQRQALENFDAAWQWLVQNCRTPEMGEPGKWCVEDRQEGACKWRDASGQCWNWFVGYRDPIANDTPNPDPGMVAETDPVTGETRYRPDPQAQAAAGGPNAAPLLIAGVLAFLAFGM